MRNRRGTGLLGGPYPGWTSSGTRMPVATMVMASLVRTASKESVFRGIGAYRGRLCVVIVRGLCQAVTTRFRPVRLAS
jgi:hypothetical protein